MGAKDLVRGEGPGELARAEGEVMKLLFDLGPVGITKQALETNKSILATLFSLVWESANTRQPP